MAVTRTHGAGTEEFFQQIERLVNSHILHGSASLCKLLRYLAEQSLEHPGGGIKEYQIATEVFGRPADFDPQLDSTIRVQAGRLRSKLAAYYSSEGADDPYIVDLRKGSYVLSFHPRAVAAKPHELHEPVTREHEDKESLAPPRPLRWGSSLVALSLVLLAAGGTIGFLWSRLTAKPKPAQSAENVPAVLTTFWKGFVSKPDEPWVIFSNGAFVGRPETGMRYFDRTRDSRDQILDHYTGVGEVLAVHELDRVFGAMHRQIRVKRGSLFPLDDARNNNLVFVGSPAENLVLREIPSTHEFTFQRMPSGPRMGDLAVMNAHPRPHEPGFFLSSPAGATLTEDYSVIALLHGMDPADSVMILAGTTTIGTQAAVEFVCQQNSLSQLLPQLRQTPSGEVEPFEAVLRVKVARGVPVETSVVALRNELPKGN